MTAKEFYQNKVLTDANCPVGKFKRTYALSELFLFADAYHNAEKSAQITSFVEWLKDNHSIEIHDMIVQDYLKYGG